MTSHPEQDPMDKDSIQVEQVWKRRPPGKERVKVERVWTGYDHDDPEALTVRARPLHGGRVLICSPEWLEDNYALLPSKDTE